MDRGNKITTLNLRGDLVEKAQDFGINLSQWVNARLNEFFNGGYTPFGQPSSNEVKPQTSLIVNMSDGFMTWMKANRYEKNYQRSLENYLTKYFKGLILSSPQNIVEYISRMKTTSNYPILALRVYIKYLVETGQLSSSNAEDFRKVLKVRQSKPDTYVPNDETVKEAYEKIKDERVKLYFEILAYSGVRVTEMAKMLSEFDKKNLTKFETYARYALNFKRGQKNSFYIFMPIEVANKVKRLYKVDAKAMTKMFDQQSGLTPKYLRKWFYNKTIIAKVPESVVDFYEGRSPATVGSSNYLAKTQQADHWYEQAMKTLKQTISL